MMSQYESHYEVLARASGGKLTPKEVYNLETYGVKDPKEFAPDPEDESVCLCGKQIDDCEEAYEHITSGC